MRQGGPIARATPLRADPAKQKAWQERSRGGLSSRSALQSTQAPRKPIQARRRPSMAPLRQETIALRGAYCRACGRADLGLEMDHVIPRSQAPQYAYDIRNTTMLCPDDHRDKTEKRLQYRRDMLDPDQLAFLAAVGWVDWQDDGLPFGRGHRGFASINRMESTDE